MLLKWAGNKQWLAPRIHALFTPQRSPVHVEPFMGTASVFLYRAAQDGNLTGRLSDNCARLVNLYHWLKIDPRAVSASLAELPDAGWEDAYYDVRQVFNDERGEWTADQAAKLIWLNRSCFNGLYRESRTGVFNVPIGSYKTRSLPSLQNILDVSELLQRAYIEHCPFEQALANIAHCDVYCDPPYAPESLTASFTQYDGFHFTDQDHVRLRDLCAPTSARCALSNSGTEFVGELFKAPLWHWHDIGSKRRSIAASSKSRGTTFEVLVTNF
jgi:DNA adenine methylase